MIARNPSSVPLRFHESPSLVRSSLEDVFEVLGAYFTRFRRVAATKLVSVLVDPWDGAVTRATKDGFRQPGDELPKRRGTRNERVSRRYLRDSVGSIPASIVPGYCDYSPGISVFSTPWNAECLENWRRHAVQIVEQAIFLSRNLSLGAGPRARRSRSSGRLCAFQRAREQMFLLKYPQRLVEEAFSFHVYYSIAVPPRRRLFSCDAG